MISFIIPAHNEEALLGNTLAAIHQSTRAVGQAYEIIVASDSSTDRTEEIAREHGARVIPVSHRQIAATRNAGAMAAAGDIFIFVDADTQVTEPALARALRTLQSGAVGGGCCVRFSGPMPTYAIALECLLRLIAPYISLAGGCFLFCTRAAYFATGGFDESLYASEEIGFSLRLRRQGRFVVLRECVITSARKLQTYSVLDLLAITGRVAIHGRQILMRREGLEFWYGPREASK